MSSLKQLLIAVTLLSVNCSTVDVNATRVEAILDDPDCPEGIYVTCDERREVCLDGNSPEAEFYYDEDPNTGRLLCDECGCAFVCYYTSNVQITGYCSYESGPS